MRVKSKGLFDINKKQKDLLETSKQAWLDPVCIAKKFTTQLNSWWRSSDRDLKDEVKTLGNPTSELKTHQEKR